MTSRTFALVCGYINSLILGASIAVYYGLWIGLFVGYISTVLVDIRYEVTK